MDLRKLARYQREFDRRHGWDWSNLRDHEKIEALNYLAVALAGEIGEFCNLVKKLRDDLSLLGNFLLKKNWIVFMKNLWIFLYMF